MTGKNTAAFGIYKREADADKAIDQLTSHGFRTEDISVLLPENLGSKAIGTVKATKAPEGATAGATAGAVVGGTLGLLAGIGAIAIPGVGPFLAAGPIMVALSGIGAGGVVGGLAGALVGMGIPEYEAKRYEGRVKNGGILFSVHCDDSEWTNRAKDVLEHTGAEDVASTGEASSDYEKSDRPLPRRGVIETGPEEESEFREHYQIAFSPTGMTYEDYAPAYRFGYLMAGLERHQGKRYSDVESNLQREYEIANPTSSWDRVKEAVRHGWEEVAGRARAATR